MTAVADSFPIERYLVSAAPPSLPVGFTEVQVSVTTGLPFTISLSQQVTLVLAVPTGQAQDLLSSDVSLTVSTSVDELTALPVSSDPVGSVDRAPARVFIQQSGTTIGSVPLALGVGWRVEDAGDSVTGVTIELVWLGWQLAVGDLIGTGNFGSFLHFAWREADLGTASFETPPIDPQIVSILRGGAATQSVLVPSGAGAPSGYSWVGSPTSAVPVQAASDGSTARAYDAFYEAPDNAGTS